MLIQNTSVAVPVPPPISPMGNGVPSIAPNVATASPSNNMSPPDPSPAQLSSAVGSLNQAMQASNISLAFSVDTSTKTPIVSVTDSATGQVVAQFPSKVTLAIAQAIDQTEKRQGLLFNQKV